MRAATRALATVEPDKNEKGLSLVKTEPLGIYPGGDLRSHTVTRAVSSARRGLTSVFGMGTGVTLAVWPPESFSSSLSGTLKLAPHFAAKVLTTALAITSSTRSRTDCESQGVLVTFLNDGLRKFYD